MKSFDIFNNLDVAQASRTQLEELLVYVRYLLARESAPEKIEWLTEKKCELQTSLLELEYDIAPSFHQNLDRALVASTGADS